MANIFISYRRHDTMTVSGRIYDRLEQEFGADRVFKDVEDIKSGTDFRRQLDDEIGKCEVQVVVIGPDWAKSADEQDNLRLHNPDDFVRIEVEGGLKREGVLVIPLLVLGAGMPRPEDLPESLRELVYRNAAIIREDPDFHRDMNRLIDLIRAIYPKQTLFNRSVLLFIASLIVFFAAAALFLLREPVQTPGNVETAVVWTLTAGAIETLAAEEDVNATAQYEQTVTQVVANITAAAIRETASILTREAQIVGASTNVAATSTADYLAVVAAYTDTPTATPTSTDTPTSTSTPTETATSPPTMTHTPIPNLTATAQRQIANETATEVIRVTRNAESPGNFPTNTPTPTETPTDTPTSTPTVTDTPVPTATNTSTQTPTITPTPNRAATATAEAVESTRIYEAARATVQAEQIFAAETPVPANADWVPIIQTFDDVQMVLVPAGCFMMGVDGTSPDERPVHEQCFDEPFWIDRTEVTVASYGECVNEGVCTPIQVEGMTTRPTQPVNRVTWVEAQRYCVWRGGHLPTEAAWEYAARGPDGLIYPWGNEFIADFVVYERTSGGEIADVGLLPQGASWVGAYDMSGNLWEWTSSAYQDYPYNADDGREAVNNDPRTIRGGSFDSGTMRATDRDRFRPTTFPMNVGFRCALDTQIDETPATPTPTPTADDDVALAQAGVTANDDWSPIVREFDGVEMVLVPTGCFIMGNDDGEPDEQPAHEQCIDQPFWIDRTEVTRSQYQQCVNVMWCDISRTSDVSIRDTQPINQVIWSEAIAHCIWRGGRLPTEAEWQFVARGPDGLIYPWGNEFVSANTVYADNANGRTADVGSRPAGVSWVGALDMSGNVSEWVSSLYSPYPYNANDGRELLTDTTANRVHMGGAFNSRFLAVSATNRNSSVPVNYFHVGFRCVRDIDS